MGAPDSKPQDSGAPSGAEPPPRAEVNTTTGMSRKRAQTRQRLVVAALEVFADVGVDAATVQLITSAAGVGFGTFYNYFDSKEAAIDAVFDAYVEGFGHRMDRAVGDEPDVARRMACATRLFLRHVLREPTWARFLHHTSVRSGNRLGGMLLRPAMDIEEGIAQGRFRDDDREMLLIGVVGILTMTSLALSRGQLLPDGPERAARETLIFLGVPAAEATSIAQGPLPSLAE